MSKETQKSNFISDNPSVREFLGFTPDENIERDKSTAQRRLKAEARRDRSEQRIKRQRKMAARIGVGLLASGTVLAAANGLVDEAGDQEKADNYADEMKGKNIQNNLDLFSGEPVTIEIESLDAAEGVPIEVQRENTGK